MFRPPTTKNSLAGDFLRGGQIVVRPAALASATPACFAHSLLSAATQHKVKARKQYKMLDADFAGGFRVGSTRMETGVLQPHRRFNRNFGG
jgi:hypothetical protein